MCGKSSTSASLNISSKGGYNKFREGNPGSLWSNCFPCPIGKEGLLCTTCNTGYYKDNISELFCTACNNKPSHSDYVESNNPTSPLCPYKCQAGYVGESCNTPSEGYFSSPLGIIVLGSIVFLSFSVGLYYAYSKIKGNDDGNGGKFSSKNDRDSLYNKEQLNESDISHFLFRLYFNGDNSFFSIWHLSPYLPNKFTSIISFNQYRYFVDDCNKELSSVIKPYHYFIYSFIYIFMYPLSFAYLKLMRKNVIIHFSQYLKTLAPYFIYINNAKQFSMKFGYSFNLVRGYIDILFTGNFNISIFPQAFYPGIKFPLVIPCSGTGTYIDPYFIDTRDMLVRSIPHAQSISVFIDQPWYEFLKTLNDHLRQVTRHSLSYTLHPLIEYLSNYADNVLQLKDAGLTVRFGRFWLGFNNEDEESFAKSKYTFGIMIKLSQSRTVSYDSQTISIRDLALGLKRVPVNAKKISKMNSKDEILLKEEVNEDLIDTTLPIPGIIYNNEKDIPKKTIFSNISFYFSKFMPRNLANTHETKYDLFLWILMIFLFICECGIFITLLIEFWCLRSYNSEGETCSRIGLFAYIFIPPLVNIVSPIYGLYSVLLQRAIHTKRFLLWNLYSYINIIVCIVLIPVSADKLVVTIMVIISIIVRTCLNYFGSNFVSYLEHQTRSLHLSYSRSIINDNNPI